MFSFQVLMIIIALFGAQGKSEGVYSWTGKEGVKNESLCDQLTHSQF